MSKIVRKNALVFGSSAGLDQIEQFGSLAGGTPNYTTDVETIQALSAWLEGWFGGVVGANLPAIEDLNGILYVLAYQIAYLLQTGIPEWNTSAIYYIGSLVNDGNGTVYVSIADANTGNALTDATKWSVPPENFSTKTANYTVVRTDRYVRGNTASSAFTFTLTTGGYPAGSRKRFKNVGTAGNNLTISSADNIDGAATYVLTDGDAIELFYTGTTWDIL
jgi:hypothetical protein